LVKKIGERIVLEVETVPVISCEYGASIPMVRVGMEVIHPPLILLEILSKLAFRYPVCFGVMQES
jgi:hypothetical protein